MTEPRYGRSSASITSSSRGESAVCEIASQLGPMLRAWFTTFGFHTGGCIVETTVVGRNLHNANQGFAVDALRIVVWTPGVRSRPIEVATGER